MVRSYCGSRIRNELRYAGHKGGGREWPREERARSPTCLSPAMGSCEARPEEYGGCRLQRDMNTRLKKCNFFLCRLVDEKPSALKQGNDV